MDRGARARTRTGRHRMARKGNQRVVIVGEGLGVLNGVVAAGVSHDGESIHRRDHVASAFLSRHTHLNRIPTPPPARVKMSVSLNPSNSLGFRSTFLPVSAAVCSPPHRTVDHPRQAVAHHHQQQSPACSIQGQDHCPKGAQFVRSVHLLFFLIGCAQLYCVRPNSGRVEPGESIDVSGACPFAVQYADGSIHDICRSQSCCRPSKRSRPLTPNARTNSSSRALSSLLKRRPCR